MSYRPLPALSALKPKYKGQQVVHGGRLNRAANTRGLWWFYFLSSLICLWGVVTIIHLMGLKGFVFVCELNWTFILKW